MKINKCNFLTNSSILSIGVNTMSKCLKIVLCIVFLSATYMTSMAEEDEYLIGAGDRIQIFVWEEQNLNISIPVRPDGRITVPLAGEIMAAKKTTSKLANEIKQKLIKYIKTPTVTVILSDMRSNVAYATGGVSKSGVYQLTHETTLLQYICMFGGFSEFAKISKAYIVRGDQKIDLNLNKLIKKKRELKYNIVIKKGDVLVVPD